MCNALNMDKFKIFTFVNLQLDVISIILLLISEGFYIQALSPPREKAFQFGQEKGKDSISLTCLLDKQLHRRHGVSLLAANYFNPNTKQFSCFTVLRKDAF